MQEPAPGSSPVDPTTVPAGQRSPQPTDAPDPAFLQQWSTMLLVLVLLVLLAFTVWIVWIVIRRNRAARLTPNHRPDVLIDAWSEAGRRADPIDDDAEFDDDEPDDEDDDDDWEDEPDDDDDEEDDPDARFGTGIFHPPNR